MALQPIGEILDNYVHYIAEQCLTIVDAIFGVENDNENEPFPFPASVNAECYGIFLINQTTANTSTYYRNGGGGKLYSYNVTYMNGEISVGGFSPIGRTDSAKWDFWGPAAGQQDTVDGEVDAYVSGTADLCYVAKTYSDRGFSYQMSSTATTNKITFGQYNDGDIFDAGAADCTCNLYTGLSQVNYSGIEFANHNMSETSPGYYDSTGVGTLPNSAFKSIYQRGLFVTSLNDDSQINNYITKNGATNNYTTTYTTEAGDTVTVYYGDNYLITKNDPDIQVSYNEVKNMLDPVINKINEDTGSDIKFPAYKELKPDPDPDIDDIDEQDMGVGTNLGGLGGYWLLTKAQLSDLHNALDTAPVGFDPLNSFISLMGLGVDASKVLDATQFQYVTPINIRMSDGTTWQTGVEAHIISSSEIVSAFNSDTFRIQRKYNNFLDYSPYATHELFIPMCGWVTLPDIAVDRDIIVTYIPDIESCKCRAVVSVVSNSEEDNDTCVIAEKDGIMGSDVPFSNVGHSLFVGDAIINGANVAGEAITMAIGAGFTKTGASGKTFRPYEGFTLGGTGTLPGAIGNALVSGNLNRTHFMTGNACKIGFADGESIIVKSVYHLPDMPDNYAHTVGLVCNKTGQLSEFNGFTVCDNPHITFSALEAEKEEIKRLLEEGVILPSGE